MVAPSPELQRKIENSKKIRKEGKNLDNYHRIFPKDYIKSKTLDILERTKPWEEKTIIKQKKEKQQKQSTTLQDVFYAPTSPTPKVLVLCVDFSDQPATLPLSSIFDKFNSTTNTSLYKYFSEVSLGKTIPTFEVFGWYRMPQTKAYYANGEYGRGAIGVRTLTNDAIYLAANDSSINWCLFDNDGDYIIDYVCIICAGYTAETTGNTDNLWSIMYGVPITIQGKTCNGFNIQTNIFMRSCEYSEGYNPVGVYCHEFAHMLGTVDIYDYSGTTTGASWWSLMGTGNYLNFGITPCNIDAYNKYIIGWLNPTINAIGTKTLLDSQSTDIVYKYTTLSSNEYYILENRQQTGWDLYIPGSGILIWHVSEVCKFYPLSTYHAYLKQADGNDSLGLGRQNADSGDPYPGSTLNRTFDKTSNPNTLLCGSTTEYLKYSITNISDSASAMTFIGETTVPGPTDVGFYIYDSVTSLAIEGATVSLDTMTATTNSTGNAVINSVSVGDHILTVSKTGYTTLTETVSITLGISIQRGLTISINTGYISCNTNPIGAEIWLDGSNTDKLTNNIVKTDAGDHTITFKKSGFEDCIKTPVTVQAGGTTTVICDLVLTCLAPICNITIS